MNPKLQNRLFKKYPNLFSRRKEKKSVMSRGIECGDGWYDIISSACSIIQIYIDNPPWIQKRDLLWPVKQRWNKIVWSKMIYPLVKRLPNEDFLRSESCFTFQAPKYQKPKNPRPQVKFEQIKEKLGVLRIYSKNEDSYIEGVLDMSVKMSMITCEDCGSTKDVKMTNTNWIRSLCPVCTRKFKKKCNKR